jgi:teichuronic acid biosynthesis glycosyltransferase TuaC
MNILIICSGNKGKINAFIKEQVRALEQEGVKASYFFITGKGVSGYLKQLKNLKQTIKTQRPEIIHAHYGLSGALAVLQRKIPVVTTFHGSDVNNKKVLWYSRFAASFSKHNIVVEKSFAAKLRNEGKTSVVPCGLNFDTFFSTDKQVVRNELCIPPDQPLILFSSAFDVPVKNYPLAKAATDLVFNSTLMELKGFSRDDVCKLMNAADLLLLTSYSEGSPQVVKEAIACGLPVVSTPVGDVPQLAAHIPGITITSYEPANVAAAIQKTLAQNARIKPTDYIKNYDNRIIARNIITIYKNIVQ